MLSWAAEQDRRSRWSPARPPYRSSKLGLALVLPGAQRDLLATSESGLWAVRNGQTRRVVKGWLAIGAEAQPQEAQGLLILALPEKAQNRTVQIGHVWSIPGFMHTWFCVTQLRQVALL